MKAGVLWLKFTQPVLILHTQKPHSGAPAEPRKERTDQTLAGWNRELFVALSVQQ